MDPKITSAIWANLEFDQASPAGKLAALWLITNEQVDVLGYADLSLRRFIFETQLTEQALAEGLQALGKGIVRTGKGYWLRNYIANQLGRGLPLQENNFCASIIKCLHRREAALVRLVLGEYPEITGRKGFVSPLEALSKGSRGSSNHKRREEKSREEQNREAKGVQGETENAPDIDVPTDEADGQRPAGLDAVLTASLSLIPSLSVDEAATFFDHYEANGWKQGGRTPLKSWRAALRNWARRNAKNSRGFTPAGAPASTMTTPIPPGVDPFATGAYPTS